MTVPPPPPPAPGLRGHFERYWGAVLGAFSRAARALASRRTGGAP
jgi:hypothetical protein